MLLIPPKNVGKREPYWFRMTPKFSKALWSPTGMLWTLYILHRYRTTGSGPTNSSRRNEWNPKSLFFMSKNTCVIFTFRNNICSTHFKSDIAILGWNSEVKGSSSFLGEWTTLTGKRRSSRSIFIKSFTTLMFIMVSRNKHWKLNI